MGRAMRVWPAHGEWPQDTRAERVNGALARRMRVHPGVSAGAGSNGMVQIANEPRTTLQLCGCSTNLKTLELRMSADRTSR